MTIFTLPLAGDLDFDPVEDRFWSFDIATHFGPLSLSFGLARGDLDDGLKKAGVLLSQLDSLDAFAREAIKKDYADENSNSRYFAYNHEEIYSTKVLSEMAGRPGVFLAEELVAVLTLTGLIFDLGDQLGFLHLGYQILDSDQILTVYLNDDGSFESIQLES